MRPDVLELEAFYSSSAGLIARRLLTRQIRELWPDTTGQRVLGLGYALPFMSALGEEAERTCAIMPQSQGCVAWPGGRPNQVALAADDQLPLADRSVDRVLMVHALESTEQARPLLREVWRVMADGAEAIVVVPNRRGVWCLDENTPFGHGRPYSSSQLKHLLASNLFTPRRTRRALFMPPLSFRFALRATMALERVGQRWARHFAGVLIMLAEKEIYAAPLVEEKTRRMPAYVPVPRIHAAAERVAQGGERKRAGCGDRG